MDGNLTYSVGAISIGLYGDLGWDPRGQEYFHQFLSSELIQAHFINKIVPIPAKPSIPPKFDTNLGWALYQDGDNWIVWVRSKQRDPYLVGFYNHDFNSGEIFTTECVHMPGKYVFPLSYPMGQLLMIGMLGTGLGLMLHSCGVIDGENGILFAGYGSAGKSTTARIWDGLKDVRVLNDDRTIIREFDGQFRIYGTPWPGLGGIARPDDAPLKKIFIIKHGSSNQAVRLPPAKAAAELLVRSFAPYWNSPAMVFTLQFLDELCMSIPCYELSFVPDQSAVEYVRCLSLD